MCAVIHKYVCIESSNLVLYPTHRINRAVTDELFVIHLHQGSSPKQTQHVLYFHELWVQNHLSREQVQSCLRHISMVTVSFNFFIYFKSFVFQPTGGLRGKISAHGGDPVAEPRPHRRLSPGAGHIRRHRNKVWPDAAQVQAFLTVTVTHGSCYRRSKLSPSPPLTVILVQAEWLFLSTWSAVLQGRCLPQAASVLQVFAALLRYREYCGGELRREREIFF